MNEQVFAGIDIGGTKIAVALADEKGERIATRILPTETEAAPEAVLDKIAGAIEEMLAEKQARLAAIGLCTPGPIDIARGLVVSPANLPLWNETPVVKILENRLHAPVVFDNDANAAALGEYFNGAGAGAENLFYVTISTGIGGALVSNGKLYHGFHAGAGEVGHTIVKPDGELCRCGIRGCLETISSGLSIARRMREKLAAQNGGNTENYASVTTKSVVEAVRRGDAAAVAVWNETIKYLAIGIGNAITLFAPDAVVIGGGVSVAGETLFEPLRREIKRNVTMTPIDKIAIRQASLGGESGLCGALMLAQTAKPKSFSNVT